MFFFFFDDDDNKVSPHTIKKFELISEYVRAWIEKLMNYPYCKGIVYIDCMSNSGVYHDKNGDEILGTPIRVADIICNVMKKYPNKQALLYFNDINESKIDVLKDRLPEQTSNFHINTSVMDGNVLLKQIGRGIMPERNLNYLLVYDPYQASIDWEAISPFLNNWGEVIINHMVSDSVRAAKVVKKAEKIEKYENTYLTDIEKLMSFGSDKDAFERRIEEIIRHLSGASSRKYYIASFPFFNSTNNVVYNLIHCTGNIEGLKLYKRIAWKVFENKSSMKNTHHKEEQLEFDFGNSIEETTVTSPTDEYCYYIKDIAKYIQNSFKGQQNVPVSQVWKFLDEHPVFPSDGYKNEIKAILKKDYAAVVFRNCITFKDQRG